MVDFFCRCHDVSAMTAWPSWVYDLYSGETLVRRVHNQMQNLKLFTQPGVTSSDILQNIASLFQFEKTILDFNSLLLRQNI